MRRFFRLTIGRKIIGLIAVLLIASIASLVAIATQMFTHDNIALIQQMNADTVASRAAEARELFDNLTQKMRLLGSVLVQQFIPDEVKHALIKEYFDDNPVFLTVYLYAHPSQPDAAPILTHKAISPALVDLGDTDGETTATFLKMNPDFSFAQLAVGEVIVGHAMIAGATPAIVLGIPFIKTEGKVTHSLVALLRPNDFLKSFNENDLVTTYMVDRRGKLLAHPNNTSVANQEDFSEIPIVQELLSGKFNNGQIRYVDPQTEEARLGAFRLVGFGGMGIIAEVPEAKAFEAANRMEYRAILLGIGVLCFAFLCGYFFSDTIIQPILALVQAAFKISKGDFNVQLKPKGRDEIAYLSYAFGRMAVGLQERDRVKELFGKFHDKEIAAKLLSGEVKLGGERRHATVLFTDIRGFTSMSEVMKPEEVVEMLNEYMTKMVSIITQHGGVIDKFVGDAIMAVWGTPISKGDDSAKAIRACLAMRQALAELNQTRIARGQSALLIGMGLNTGDVTAGNIGSAERMEYTVIGDAVNLSARIESLTKELGTDLLISKTVQQEVEGRFILETCNEIAVRGKSERIELFKVHGYVDENGTSVVVETPYSRLKSASSAKEQAV